MGLDSFQTSSSGNSRSGGSSSSHSKLNSVQSVSSSKPTSEETPKFTAIVDQTEDEVECYVGSRAFPRTSRHKYETVLAVIETEDELERISEKCKELHDRELTEFFQNNPNQATDFVKRLSVDGKRDTKEDCPVCGDEVDATRDNYTSVNDRLIHADHKVADVVEAMGLGE